MRQLSLQMGSDQSSICRPGLHLPVLHHQVSSRALHLSGGSHVNPSSWHCKTMVVSANNGQFYCDAPQISYPFRALRTLIPPEREPPPEIAVVRNVNLESREAFDGIVAALSQAGLRNYRLAPREAALARRTPEMPWRAFAHVFGGALHSERPIARMAQPFAPAHTGEPGVLLFHLSSSTSTLLETEAFHLLVDSSVRRKNSLKYCGVYTRVHTPNVEVQVGEWHALPSEFQRHMLYRLRRVSTVSDLHARCNLRKRHGPDSDLSPTKIDDDGSEAMMCRALRPSFDSGHEKFNFAVIKCVGFDPKLAKIIEQKTNRRTHAH
ncbi:hypothetical protein EDB83DRAFT_2368090 [Lactarius deliciosus]|nr:hypothetical protein EDB83DRAFT_2368090 [Lactarius deliciosus]